MNETEKDPMGNMIIYSLKGKQRKKKKDSEKERITRENSRMIHWKKVTIFGERFVKAEERQTGDNMEWSENTKYNEGID